MFICFDHLSCLVNQKKFNSSKATKATNKRYQILPVAVICQNLSQKVIGQSKKIN